MWEFKFTPPGRGLWVMGTDLVYERGSAALQNCSMISSEGLAKDFAGPFCFLMDMSMLGVGVGGDTRGAGKVRTSQPEVGETPFVVEDSREGWVELLRAVLNSFVGKNPYPPAIDFSRVRGRGEPIKTFGGVASGPAPLQKLIEGVTRLLLPPEVEVDFEVPLDDKTGKIGVVEVQFSGPKDLPARPITSTLIVDVFNYIGKCVVAGGVRRCLPEGTLIHTDRGLVPIEEVEAGHHAMTSKGYSPVEKRLQQGVQSLSRVVTQMGTFEATGKHQVAVITDTKGGYGWKRVQDLLPGDRMVFVDRPLEGCPTNFPDFAYNAPKHSTTCRDIVVPDLTAETAWFLGLLAGDGYVRLTQRAGEVSIAIAADQEAIKDKAVSVLGRFGVNVGVAEPKKGDGCFRVRVKSKQLASFLSRYKQPRVPLRVPDIVLRGPFEVRAAYVAGLADADGCFKGHSSLIAASVYPDYLKQVQAVLASLGVPSRLSQHREATRRWQALFYLKVLGDKARRRFSARVADFVLKFEDSRKTSRSGHDYGFPPEMALADGISGWDGTRMAWCRDTPQITVAKLEELTGREVALVPVEVLEVREDVRSAPTFDLTVEAGEFVAQGYLVHNSSEIMFGEPDDQEFVTLKQDQEALNDRRWVSNNSVFAHVGMSYKDIAESIAVNGEPGLLWLENARLFSRMKDPPDSKDWHAAGTNPCSEITLESGELCNLAETYPAHHDDYEDFERTLKSAFLYAKTVTLVPTHVPSTNAVMTRNRRLGCSMSGIVQAMHKHGRRTFFQWCDRGYGYLRRLDRIYSGWLGIPESIKLTTTKPSGTVSLLCGATPGIHFPHSRFYIRHIRVQNTSPLVQAARDAGYDVVDDPYADDTSVVAFPVKEKHFHKGKAEVSLWEQFVNVVDMQHYWADNQISVTASFKKEEARDIQPCLEAFEDRLKGISLLPLADSDHGYQYPPYQEITEEEYKTMSARLRPIDFSGDVHDRDSEDKFCNSDSCELKLGK